MPAETGWPSITAFFSIRCQPRGRTSRVAISSLRRYSLPLPGFVNSNCLRTASYRFS